MMALMRITVRNCRKCKLFEETSSTGVPSWCTLCNCAVRDHKQHGHICLSFEPKKETKKVTKKSINRKKKVLVNVCADICRSCTAYRDYDDSEPLCMVHLQTLEGLRRDMPKCDVYCNIREFEANRKDVSPAVLNSPEDKRRRDHIISLIHDRFEGSSQKTANAIGFATGHFQHVVAGMRPVSDAIWHSCERFIKPSDLRPLSEYRPQADPVKKEPEKKKPVKSVVKKEQPVKAVKLKPISLTTLYGSLNRSIGMLAAHSIWFKDHIQEGDPIYEVMDGLNAHCEEIKAILLARLT